MTFEDGIAYSRNVVAAKVALGLSDTTAGSSAMVFDTWRKLGYGARTGIDVAGEVGGLVRDPANVPWAPDRPRQRRVRPGRRGHADPARDRVRHDHQWRDDGQAARGPGHRLARRRGDARQPGREACRCQEGSQADGPRRRRRSRSIATGPSSRATTSAARRARRRSGTPRPTRAGARGSTTSSTTRSSDTSRARATRRTSWSPSASRRAPRRSPVSASWRCPSCRSSCSAASPPTRSRRPIS